MSITDLTYTATTTTTSSVSLEVEARVSVAGADVKVEHWYNLDADSEPQVETVTIDQTNLATVDAYYKVTVAGPTVTKTYAYEFDADAIPALTEDDVALELAALVNLHPEVAAAIGSTGFENDIVITGTTPGTAGAFTVTVACVQVSDNSTVSSAISTTTTASASGTGQVRKLGEVTVGPTIDANRKAAIQFKSGSFFNGAATPVSVQTNPTSSTTHPQTMDTIRANNA